MARWRSILALSFIAVWLATPVLACLPNSQMTAVEMACCKKMAGDCHMGVGPHPCCKTVSNALQPVASLQPVPQIHPDFAVLDVAPLVQVLFVSRLNLSKSLSVSLHPPLPVCTQS